MIDVAASALKLSESLERSVKSEDLIWSTGDSVSKRNLLSKPTVNLGDSVFGASQVIGERRDLKLRPI